MMYLYFPGTFGRYLTAFVDIFVSLFPPSIIEALVSLLCRIELNSCGMLEAKNDIADVFVSVSKYESNLQLYIDFVPNIVLFYNE